MRICYALLSPTWGMHQYTADLAGRMAAAGHEVQVVTTVRYPAGRYGPGVTIHTPFATADTGFSAAGLHWGELRKAQDVLLEVGADVVHFTGPHLWNPLLLRALRRAGIPTVHTLHDLHPHAGAAYGPLLYLWNRWVGLGAYHLLVHGECHCQWLLARGVAPERMSCTQLTHLFVGYAQAQAWAQAPLEVRYEPWALFMGRLEAYKGLDVLVKAAQRAEGHNIRLVVAGPGRLDRLVDGPVPANVEVRAGLIGDEEAADLFCRCGLVVLPYAEASQSALVAAAYFFRKPVVVTRAGALPEYVVERGPGGRTGWVIPPGDPQALAEALAEALADPERLARMGRSGRVWYEEQRQAETATLEQIYAQAAARRPVDGGAGDGGE